EVTYNVLILPYAEIKKDDVKKWSGTSTILTLHLDEPFDTFKAQILCKIDKETSPATLSFDNYKAFFSIVRISPKPTSLSDEDDYKELIKCLMKIKEPIVTIYVQELSDLKKVCRKDRASYKENGSSGEDSSDEGQRRKRKKKKTQKTKALNRNITKLTDRWVCHKKPGCHSEHCFVNPGDGGSHIPLSFPLLDCWASAMEKGPEYATLEMPPNHSHFSMVPIELLGHQSLLAVRCQQQQANEQAKKLVATPAPASSGPVVNVNFPPELFQAIRGLSAPMASQFPSQNLAPAMHPAPSLLSPAQLTSLGPQLTLIDFCSMYEISDTLRKKLLEHGFNSSHSLRYVTIDDLQKVGLLCGELAELKDAISRWCGE
ncbi:uncharacterized protein HD556DRAFT_1237028, partial [Suillus plorans]